MTARRSSRLPRLPRARAFPGFTAYSATKVAVRSFVRTWTAELKDRRIRVNAVSPGPIDTPIFEQLTPTKKGVDQARAQFIAANVPCGFIPLNTCRMTPSSPEASRACSTTRLRRRTLGSGFAIKDHQIGVLRSTLSDTRARPSESRAPHERGHPSPA
jgi:NAD(P)-dependent dehydrogenase (short-subunit alcohol dehydrogenase family)